MKKGILVTAVIGLFLLAGALACQGATWVKMDFDAVNKSVDANSYDAESIKVVGKSLSWTEKFDLTISGSSYYSRHLAQYPLCQQNMTNKGEVTYHQVDLQIKEGKFRQVAKRNYSKNNELICTDKEMGKEFDTSWNEIIYESPLFYRYYEFVTKYKLGNI
jgi:hypothetical protein